MINHTSLRNRFNHLKWLLQKEQNWDQFTYVAIVSTGRTGTKFLSHYFSNHSSNIFAEHEPFGQDTLDLGINLLSFRTKVDSIRRLFKNARKYKPYLLHDASKEIYLESDGNLAFLIPLIRDSFPKYKIVHIIRDGKAVVRSFCSRIVEIKGKIIQKYSIETNWRVTPKVVGDKLFADNWHTMSLIEKGAWAWVHRNQLILEAINNDSNAITIRFEDIFDSNKKGKGLEELIEFIGAEMTLNSEQFRSPLGQQINQTNQFMIAPYDQWPKETREKFDIIAYDLNSRFSY